MHMITEYVLNRLNRDLHHNDSEVGVDGENTKEMCNLIISACRSITKSSYFVDG